MRPLDSALIVAKNKMYDVDPWLSLLEIEKRGWYRLNYDALTTAFSEDSIVASATDSSSARILFVVPITSTTGYLIIDPADPDADAEIFTDNNSITDDEGGGATINGTLNTATHDPITFRFVRNTEDITFDSNIYTAFPFDYNALKYADNKFASLEVTASNAWRMLESYMRKGNGFLGERVRLIVIYAGALTSNPAIDELFEIKKTSADADAIILTLGINNPINSLFPKNRHSRKICRFLFKSTECGYSGVATSCVKTLARCLELENEERFGGFPAIPGSFFNA